MEENRTMTAAERAALADAREAEAQRRKYQAQRQSTAASRTATAVQGTPARQTGNIPPANKGNTREYPKTASYIKQANGAKRPVKQGRVPVNTAPAQNPEEKTDTGEFPSYVRAGKGGYHPPKPRKRVVARHRRKLDPKFKAAMLAIGTVAAMIIILLLAGVRYSTYKLPEGRGEIRFFGLVKDGAPSSGWISASDGTGGKLGDGRIEYSDGSLYEGGIMNAMRSGEGTLTYANGDVYKGYFSENELNGKGTVSYANGDSYEGNFINGKKHGEGTLKYKTDDGYDIYTGDFADDMRHGKGVMTYASGDTYNGEFAYDKRDGEGTYSHANGRTFVGTYKNNLRFEGTFTFENKAKFEGTFETSASNQMLEGTYTYANGSSVTGRYDKATNSFIAY